MLVTQATQMGAWVFIMPHGNMLSKLAMIVTGSNISSQGGSVGSHRTHLANLGPESGLNLTNPLTSFGLFELPVKMATVRLRCKT
jgi:hypothetical protein